MDLSLKVPVAHLIERAEAHRKSVVDAHAKLVKEHKASSLDVKEALSLKLSDAARDVASGKVKPREDSRYRDGKYRHCVETSVWIEVPPKPDKKADTSAVDRDLRLLRATSQETITVRVGSSLEKYL
jgi:hypothetical protein